MFDTLTGMTSDDVFDALIEIGKARGKDKELLLTKYLDDKWFAKTIRMALDPFITFGIATLPLPAQLRCPAPKRTFDAGTWTLLTSLALRHYTGNLARQKIAEELGKLTPQSREVFCWILLKDLRAGFTEKTVNKTRKGFIPVFSAMLAHKFEPSAKLKYPVFVEEKLDGVRCLVYVDKQGIQFLSRIGKNIAGLDHLIPYMAMLAPLGEERVFDGELKGGDFNTTVSAVRSADAAPDVRLHLFDSVPLADFKAGVCTQPQRSRRKMLAERVALLGKDSPVLLTRSWVVANQEEIYATYEQIRATGGEGVIVKDPEGHYVTKRSKSWLKIKAVESEDLRVVGYFEGTGKYEGMLGGFIIDRSGVKVSVGGGFTDQERETFWQMREQMVGAVIEVEYHEVTPDGSLRHPRFKAVRPDKVYADFEQAA